MPKETFFNLPPDKRERLIDAALDELVRYPFDQASISRIVAATGIAKGSFYQYFEDKLDLFSWLCEEGGRRRAAWFHQLANPQPTNPFDRLRFAYREGLGLWRAEPRWTRVGLRLLEPSEDARLGALRARNEAAVHAFLVALLRHGQADGTVRPDIDPEQTAWLASGLLQEGLLRAFFASLGTTLERWPDEAASVSDERLAEAMGAAIAAVDLLEAAVGVGRRGGVSAQQA